MKKDRSVLTSGSGNGIKGIFTAVILAVILLTGTFFHRTSLYGTTSDLGRYTIDGIYFKSGKYKKIGKKQSAKYLLLLEFKPGDLFNYKKNRKSMENLYKAERFSNVETGIEILPKRRLNIYYTLSPKYTIGAVKIKKSGGIKRRALLSAVFSLRKRDWFGTHKLDSAVGEIRNFLSSRGYFNPKIEYRLITFPQKVTPRMDIHFYIEPGPLTAVNKIFWTSPETLFPKIRRLVEAYFDRMNYIPYQFQKAIEKVKRALKKQKYYFPEVRLKETFLDEQKSRVDLDIYVKPGYRYIFRFKGIKNKIDLIASIWEKKVFEKWAEKESSARILYHLKSKGYLNARVDSVIHVEKFVKTITFNVKKGRKYRLGNIRFIGNESFSEKEMKKVIKTDDLFFDKFFWLRATSLAVDREVLRLFYYFKGFPSANILIDTRFRGKKADIDMVVNEGKKFTVDTVLFDGNRAFDADLLSRMLKTRSSTPQKKQPFVQHVLNEDIEGLKNFYYSRGFDRVVITPEISPGTEKSILIKIDEGPRYRVGNLIVIGASQAQGKLIRRQFPLKANDFYNRLKIETFRSDIENSSIFTEFSITTIKKSDNVLDVLVKVIPDKNSYYGFGAGGGWIQGEKPRLRGTLEYQQRNIFNGYSTLSGIFQLGNVEGELGLRGLISYDTPFLFRRKVNSELKFWVDNEQYPSYNFTRFGFSESIIQKISLNSYMLASFSLYNTRLNELDIIPTPVDQVGVYRQTSALRLSYVRDKRNDPFNPTSGVFFSSDLKLGLLMAERHYPFIKFRWSFQKIFKLLKNGTLAFSLRNGLADGELSITERYFAGGVNTFRGTKTDGLGPIDIISGKPRARGGNALFLANLEATFPVPLIPSNELYYSIFADVGNVFDRIGQFRFDEMEKAIGFGLKLKTELGPLRLDFAWNLDRTPEEGNFRIHIGIGNVL